MEKSDIISHLSNYVEELSSATRLGTYSIPRLGRSALLGESQSKSTRGNTPWKMAQYVVIPTTKDDKIDISDNLQAYLKGWRALMSSHGNQFLILEVAPGKWQMFNYDGEFMGDNDFIMSYIPNIEEQSDKSTIKLKSDKDSLQLIIFGAPGTGKSNFIKKITTDVNSIRTTFHPDSDYSTFVGCYKPTMKSSAKKSVMAANDLVEKASAISGVANQVQFICDNAESIVLAANELEVSTNKLIWDRFGWHNKTYFVSILTSILEERKKNKVDEITYDFCPQAFTYAYVRAWQNPDTSFYLIIEEINRGNCAQIFGDIFQLLDRDENGLSRYDIAPDSDLQNYLRKTFEDSAIEDEAIKSGASMQLPPNLHIWATMNTSDQSLFPIDSAFKRRWDWKYIPIDYTDRGHYISCNGKKYSWAKFLKRVNQDIEGVTHSEDKKLGYWFTGNSASQLEITANKFVSKVVFFLWNDVFKDFGHNGKTIFKDDFSKFHLFFDFTGKVKEHLLEKFLQSLELTPNDATDKADSEEAETAE